MRVLIELLGFFVEIKSPPLYVNGKCHELGGMEKVNLCIDLHDRIRNNFDLISLAQDYCEQKS